MPVAFEEHDELETATVILVEKFVQPLNWRYDGGEELNVESYFVTELTTIVSGSAPGWLWCSAASSAADAMIAVPWL